MHFASTKYPGGHVLHVLHTGWEVGVQGTLTNSLGPEHVVQTAQRLSVVVVQGVSK